MMISRPAARMRETSICTLVTSGQVASNTCRPRASASARTACDTPWAENTTMAPAGVLELVDEHRALGAQVFHHIAVVDDLMAHVDRRAMQFQRALDDVDGAIHPGTEAARLRQHDLGAGGGNGLAHHSTPNSATSTRRRTPAEGWLKSNRADSSLISLSTPE